MKLTILVTLLLSLAHISLSQSNDIIPSYEESHLSTSSAPIHSLVFLLPPSSFAFGQITLGLELYKRGHRVVFATLDGLQKHYDQQYHSIKLNNEEKRRTLIEPEVISFGESPDFGDHQMLKLASADPSYFNKHPALAQQAMKLIEAQYAAIVEGINQRESELGSSHPFYADDTLFIVSMAMKTVTNHINRRSQSYVVVFPTPAMASILSSPVFQPSSPFSSDIPNFNKTLTQRIKCLFQSFMTNVVFGKLIPYPIPMMDTSNLYTKPTLKLIASLPSLTTLKSYPPLTIFTGPLVNKDRTAFELLDPQIQKILSGPLPVVYISLGTFSEIGSPQIDFIVNSTIPEDRRWAVIWSLKDESKKGMNPVTAHRISALGDLYTIVPWTHTPSILAHKNNVLFVSHCGGNGISEGVALGKPILGLPLFGDQHANCAASERNIGSARCFTLGKSSTSELLQLVKDIVSNPQDHIMVENARKAMILSNVAYRGTETAANWLETVAALKGDVRMLETPVEREGVIKSYCLDLLAGALLLILFLGFWTGRLLPWCCGKVASKVANKAVQKIGVTRIASFVLVWGCWARSRWLAFRGYIPVEDLNTPIEAVKAPIQTITAPIRKLTSKEDKPKNE